MALAGCGGNFTSGTGGAGGTTTTPSSGNTSSGNTSSGNTSSGNSSSGNSSSGNSSSSGSSTSSSGGSCTNCSMPGFACCNGECVDTKDDIRNCGTCGNKCTGTHPYCNMGTCGDPVCIGGSATCTAPQFCCGTTCCTADELCCDVPGPVVLGPKCQAPNAQGTCDPGCTGCVCNSPDTPIATPLGDRPISELAAGDLVYSVDREAIVAVPILRTHHASVHDHHVVRVTLSSGTVLEISPGHPTADGRTFGDLHRGDSLDRFTVTNVELIPYTHPFTYDILPASDTHRYFAGGALIGTTMPY